MYDTLGNRTIQRAPIYIYIYTDHRFSKEPPHAASSQSQRIKLRAMFTSCKLSKAAKNNRPRSLSGDSLSPRRKSVTNVTSRHDSRFVLHSCNIITLLTRLNGEINKRVVRSPNE